MSNIEDVSLSSKHKVTRQSPLCASVPYINDNLRYILDVALMVITDGFLREQRKYWLPPTVTLEI